jgi:hypothetical protein
MVARAGELGFRVPAWCLPHTLRTVEDFAERVGYPLVIKPYDGVACVSTHKISSPAELQQVWAAVSDRRHDLRVEEFVTGRQFHVDTILRRGEPVFEAVSAYTVTLLDNLRDHPLGSIALAGEQSGVERALLAATRALICGLGLQTGIAHTEFFLTERGELVFGETGARPPGAWGIPLYRAAFGVSLAYEWARTELDPGYVPRPPWRRFAGGELLFTRARGRIEQITSAEALARLPFVSEAQVWKAPGDLVGDAREVGSQALGHVVVTGSSVAEVAARLEQTRHAFTVVAS